MTIPRKTFPAPVLTLTSLALLPFLGACATSTRNDDPAVDPNRAVILLTPEQAKQQGYATATNPPPPIPESAADTVLQSPQVRAYRIGRYQDPSDPNLLHEGHVVYRKETDGRWVLDKANHQALTLGPATAQKKPESVPFQEKELDAILIDLARQNRENRQTLELLCRAVDSLARKVDSLPASSPSEGKASPAASKP